MLRTHSGLEIPQIDYTPNWGAVSVPWSSAGHSSIREAACGRTSQCATPPGAARVCVGRLWTGSGSSDRVLGGRLNSWRTRGDRHMGYAGMLLGPPMIGGVNSSFAPDGDLRYGMGLDAALMFGLALLCGVVD